MGTGMAIALKAGVEVAPLVINAVTDLIQRYQNGEITQDEFNVEWHEMNSDWEAYSNRWELAKKKAAELRAAEGSN